MSVVIENNVSVVIKFVTDKNADCELIVNISFNYDLVVEQYYYSDVGWKLH